MSRHSLASLCVVALLALTGCAQDDPEPLTQVVVTVSGDDDVLAQLTRIEARIYRTEALFDPQPMVAHTFTLPATMPLSFGVQQRDAPRFLLVLEGYGAEAGRPPIIERKVRAAFTDDRTMQLDVQLVSACLQIPSPCVDLQHTCHADLSTCGPVEQAAMRETDVGKVLTPALPPRPEVPIACRDVTCPAGYPCTPTIGGGHVCLGQFADWPMPDETPGAKHRPKYDLSIEGIVRDEVTGLLWQREPPATYPNCSRRHMLQGPRGSGCNHDEATHYCRTLTLGGLSWRLPSKIEVFSISDFQTSVSGWAAPFEGCPYFTWTSSLFPPAEPGNVRNAWYAFSGGMVTGYRAVTEPLCVRCVSGVPTAPGSGSARYVPEPDQTVRDVFTGLRWQHTFSDSMETVEEATAYCAKLGNDFRVPTLKELMSLTDPSRYYPTIDPIFTDTPAASFWAAPGSGGSSEAQAVAFASGDPDDLTLAVGATDPGWAPPRVRCVR